MRIHRSRTTALATLAGLALALTACGGSGSAGGAAGPPATSPAPAPSGSAPAPGPDPDPAPSGTATPTAATPTAAAASPSPDGKGTGAAGAATDDSYAYTHPCSARNITVKVTAPQGFPATVRVVTVTNNGAATCGLDLHPAVGFSAKGAALGVQATPPDGLGGAPAHPVRPGATAYAAVDLNPSGGAGPVADEINILADPAHMPNADATSLPLATPAAVSRPRVGVYHFSARDSFNSLR
ncbi:hypothetical protein GCM10010302_66250 [Streptomyces polychromogenes]|uniref:DUF4232 domain-containing protein n=1 Tax=Streptomyces polychromogenes TaxID=67342 RepID=A0ABN0VUW7_9ACTN